MGMSKSWNPNWKLRSRFENPLNYFFDWRDPHYVAGYHAEEQDMKIDALQAILMDKIRVGLGFCSYT
ncbi:hypothetical protein R1flu_023706 [Riccia fluitans]|uniref:Uncharacterized protein n=1 Tax=Riccia fluitans TaxID=41844 RepID=A0ABD1XTA8_9MARC